MKFLQLPLSVLAALGFAGQVAAATGAASPVPVTGNVAQLCVLGSPNPASININPLSQTSGTNIGRVVAVGEQDITLPGSFCNYAGTNVTITTSALVAADTTPVQPGFSRAVNFTSAVTTWAPTPATVTTASDATGSNAGVTQTASGGTLCKAQLTDLKLALSNFTAPSNNLLVAGGYSGTVTITLGPSASGCGV